VISRSGNFQTVIIFSILAYVPFRIFMPPHYTNTMEESKVVAFLPPVLGKLQLYSVLLSKIIIGGFIW
jgi:hypothetical protein